MHTPANTCEITINGIPAKVNPSLTVMQACESVNRQIPHFCFHDTLGVAGNCRMCLVEVQPSTKPVPLIASCAMLVSPKMQIFTDTALIKKVREGVLEFLLSTHPLDCPICDQGGECDLQDHSLLFGSDRGRFYETKKAVSDKQCGPLIKTVMTRCIQCTRCVRFATDVAGTPILGITGRGATMEIGFYMDRLFASELSGNMIDLCPVGALTSKPYAFTARPWELKKVNSIDPFDAINSNIEVNLRGLEIMRILPKINTAINGDWIPDKVRFNFDGFLKQIAMTPMFSALQGSIDPVKQAPVEKALRPSWDLMFLKIQQIFHEANANIQHIFGPSTSFEELAAIKFFFNRLGYEHFSALQSTMAAGPHTNSDFRDSYLCSTPLASFDQLANHALILLINCNIKTTLPILEAKLHQAYKKGCNIFVLGAPIPSTYKYTHISMDVRTLHLIAQGKHWLCTQLLAVKQVLLFCDSGLQYTKAISAQVEALRKTLRVNKVECALNFLRVSNSGVHLQELGMLAGYKAPKRGSDQKQLQFFWQASQLVKEPLSNNNAVNVFVGSNVPHTEVSKAFAVILPTTNCFENGHQFINLNGMLQKTAKVLDTGRYQLPELLEALFLFVDNKPDRAITKRLAYFGNGAYKQLPWASFFRDVAKGYEHDRTDSRQFCSNFSVSATDYYITDIVSKSSKTMLNCSKAFNKQKPLATF